LLFFSRIFGFLFGFWVRSFSHLFDYFCVIYILFLSFSPYFYLFLTGLFVVVDYLVVAGIDVFFSQICFNLHFYSDFSFLFCG